jgi:hypothetical protein
MLNVPEYWGSLQGLHNRGTHWVGGYMELKCSLEAVGSLIIHSSRRQLSGPSSAFLAVA